MLPVDCRCATAAAGQDRAWLWMDIRKERRYCRLTPRRALLVILAFAVNMSLWNSWTPRRITSSSSSSSLPNVHLPFFHFPKRLSPFALPLPTLQPKYTVGETVRGCSELLHPINTTRLELLKNASRTSRPDQVEHLKRLVQNCTALKIQHSYWRWPVAPQERQFPLAFGFKMHNSPDMFERLLRVIWRPHNLYIVHVDLATPNDTFHVIQDLASCFDNVLLTEVRINVVYASVWSLYADIESVKVALKSSIPWKYYLSVSGHEFPLKTNLEMVQILRLLNGVNDVENYPPGAFIANMLKKAVWPKGKQNFLTSKLRAPFKHKNVTLRKGSAYFAATRKFLEWVLPHPVCQDFLVWLKETWAADEMFWATANYLPGAPGGGQVDVRHDRHTFLSRAMAWHWDQYKCQGHYIRHVCVFGAGDLKWLLSRSELIANKFDNDKDPLVLDCLERELEERAERGFQEVKAAAAEGTELPLLSSLKWDYYKALPHVRGRVGVGVKAV